MSRKAETKLTDLAERISKTGRRVSPMQRVALLLEDGLTRLYYSHVPETVVRNASACGDHRMAKAKSKMRLSQNLQDWIAARQRHRLSHAQVQMARELGMNPRKLGKLDNHDQERWKLPLPQFIEHLYEKRFGSIVPQTALSIEQIGARQAEKKAQRRARKAQRNGAIPPSTQ